MGITAEQLDVKVNVKTNIGDSDKLDGVLKGLDETLKNLTRTIAALAPNMKMVEQEMDNVVSSSEDYGKSIESNESRLKKFAKALTVDPMRAFGEQINELKKSAELLNVDIDLVRNNSWFDEQTLLAVDNAEESVKKLGLRIKDSEVEVKQFGKTSLLIGKNFSLSSEQIKNFTDNQLTNLFKIMEEGSETTEQLSELFDKNQDAIFENSENVPVLTEALLSMADSYGTLTATSSESQKGMENFGAAGRETVTILDQTFKNFGETTDEVLGRIIGNAMLVREQTNATLGTVKALGFGMQGVGRISGVFSGGIVGLSEVLEAGGTVATEFGASLRTMDSELANITGTALLVTGVLSTGFAAIINRLIFLLGDLTAAIGQKLFSAMRMMEMRFLKFERTLKVFDFAIRGFGESLGVDAVGSVKEWNAIMDEMVKKTRFTTADVAKGIKILVAEGTTLGISFQNLTKLLKIAGDVAVFQGRDLTEVILAFFSAMTGNATATLALGIDLRELALIQAGLVDETKKSIKEMTAMEKQQVRMLAIFKKTKPIIGAAASDLETFSGKVATLEKSVDLLSIKLGQMGKFTNLLVSSVTGLVNSLINLPDIVLDLVGNFIDLGGVFLTVIGNVTKYIVTITTLVTAFKVFKVILMESIALQAAFTGALTVDAIAMRTFETATAATSKGMGIFSTLTLAVREGAVGLGAVVVDQAKKMATSIGVTNTVSGSLFNMFKKLAAFIGSTFLTVFSSFGKVIGFVIIQIKALTVAMSSNPLFFRGAKIAASIGVIVTVLVLFNDQIQAMLDILPEGSIVILKVVSAIGLLVFAYKSLIVVQGAFFAVSSKIAAMMGVQIIAVGGMARNVTSLTAAIALLKFSFMSFITVTLPAWGAAIAAATVTVLKFTAALLVNPLFLTAAAIAAGIALVSTAIADIARETDLLSISTKGLTKVQVELEQSNKDQRDIWKEVVDFLKGSMQLALEITKASILGIVKVMVLANRTWKQFKANFQEGKELEDTNARIQELTIKLAKFDRAALASKDMLNSITIAMFETSKGAKGLNADVENLGLPGPIGDFHRSVLLLPKAIASLRRGLRSAFDEGLERAKIFTTGIERAKAQSIEANLIFNRMMADLIDKGEKSKVTIEQLQQSFDNLAISFLNIEKARADSFSKMDDSIRSLENSILRSSGRTKDAIKSETDVRLQELDKQVEALVGSGKFSTDELKKIEKLRVLIIQKSELDIQNLRKKSSRGIKSQTKDLNTLKNQLKGIESANIQIESAIDNIGATQKEVIDNNLAAQTQVIDNLILEADLRRGLTAEQMRLNQEIISGLEQQKALKGQEGAAKKLDIDEKEAEKLTPKIDFDLQQFGQIAQGFGVDGQAISGALEGAGGVMTSAAAGYLAAALMIPDALDAISGLLNQIETLPTRIMESFLNLLNSIDSLFQNFLANIVTAITGIVTGMIKFIVNLPKMFNKMIKNLSRALVEFIKMLPQAFADLVTFLATGGPEIGIAIAQGLLEAAVGIGQAIGEAFFEIASNVRDARSNVAGGFNRGLDAIKKGDAKALGGEIARGFKGTFGTGKEEEPQEVTSKDGISICDSGGRSENCIHKAMKKAVGIMEEQLDKAVASVEKSIEAAKEFAQKQKESNRLREREAMRLLGAVEDQRRGEGSELFRVLNEVGDEVGGFGVDLAGQIRKFTAFVKAETVKLTNAVNTAAKTLTKGVTEDAAALTKGVSNAVNLFNQNVGLALVQYQADINQNVLDFQTAITGAANTLTKNVGISAGKFVTTVEGILGEISAEVLQILTDFSEEIVIAETKFTKKITELNNDLATDVGLVLSQFTTDVTDDLSMLSGAIASAIQTFQTTLGAEQTSLGTDIANESSTFVTDVGALVSLVEGIMLNEGTNFSLETQTALTELVTQIAARGIDFGDTIVEHGTEFGDSIVTAANTLKQTVETEVGKFITEINFLSLQMITDLKEAGTTFNLDVLTASGTFQTDVEMAATNAATSITTAGTDFETDVETALTTFKTDVTGNLTTFNTSVATSLSDFVTDIGASTTTLLGTVTKEAETLNTEIKRLNKVFVDDVEEKIKAFTSAVNTATTTFTTNVTDEATTLVSNLNDWADRLDGLLNPKEESTGVDLKDLDDFWDGLKGFEIPQFEFNFPEKDGVTQLGPGDLSGSVGAFDFGPESLTIWEAAALAAIAANKGMQHGGLVGGSPGHGDTVGKMLTPGEFVLNKPTVQRIGPSVLDSVNRGGKIGQNNSFDISIQIDTSQPIDEDFIRDRLVPSVKDELSRASQDGELIVSSSGVF